MYKLRNELLRLFPKSHDEDIRIEAHVTVGYSYSKSNPDKSEHAAEVWDTMVNYSKNYNLMQHYIQMGEGEYPDETLNEFLMIADENDNWNHPPLPASWSKDMHLIHSFH